MQDDSKTKVFAIIGYPLRHTISPQLHNAAFKYLKYNANYVILRVKPGALKKKLAELKKSRIAGLNVTIPHKETIIRLLDGLSSEAKLIGAVNTVKAMQGKFIGYNTDGEGFLRSLKDENILPKDKRILCLGAGGVARAIVWTLAEHGASKILIANRSKDRAKRLVSDFKREFAKCAFGVTDFRAEGLKEWLKNSDLLINTTPLGLRPSDPLLVKPEWLTQALTVYDVIYKDTPLVRACKKRGIVAINGLGMLVHQAALSFELWTGKRAPLGIMRDAANNVIW